MSVANSGLAGSISGVSAAVAANSVNVAANTTSITKLQPFIIVDSVPSININSGTASYAFTGKPQGGAVDGIYLFNISFDLRCADTRMNLTYGIENTAAGVNHVLEERCENSTGCAVRFSYSGVVEITSLSPNVGITVEATTLGTATNLLSGSMVWTRISAA